MKRKTALVPFRERVIKLSLIIALTVLLASCAGKTGQAAKQPAPSPAPGWPEIYLKAIEDAKNPEPDEIVFNLVPITRENKNLIWKQFNGVSHLLMASLVSNTSYYEGHAGKPYNMENYYAWVTIAPKLQELCVKPAFKKNGLALRLRQILGLTPNATVTAFVQFWVKQDDLFRPAPDNEITDNTAGLTIPPKTAPWYRKWFNDLRAKQYFQSGNPENNAYPWTQLGYTYDWGNPNPPHQGLSEFVIKAGSEVFVEGIYSINRYCNKTNK